MINQDLIKKYDIPAPRYTSYPTVPFWSNNPTTKQWLDSVNETLGQNNAAWSMYIHLPFCETLCTFCGCNTSITKNHSKEDAYVQNLLKEWALYKEQCPDLLQTPLRQLHLGGGTPTFFSPENLVKFLKPMMEDIQIDYQNFDGSVEVDPRRTSFEHLKALYQLGFKRISLGVQDFDHTVQKIVNRVQSFEITKELTEQARELGYDSVNFDLIYGLPKQTIETIETMAYRTIDLMPDRIALYSFALVPWIKPQQRLFKDEDVPKGDFKRSLYERARTILLEAGYKEIGMDHFALETDSLYKSANEKRMHRNFMGYADLRTDLLLGLGVSSISESPSCFHQNEKLLPKYEEKLNSAEIPTLRGHLLDGEDQLQREKILRLMTQFEVDLDESEASDIQDYLASMIEDELVRIENGKMQVTEMGKIFIRNIAMSLDLRLRRKAPDRKVFSQSL